jgi:tetratricopeptide (TPR) repeat protein
VDLAREEGEDYHAVDAAHMMGSVEPAERQLEWSLKAMEMAERSDDPKTHSWLGPLYNNIGWSYHDLGRYEEALEQFNKSVAWREQEGKRRETGIARWSVGRALRSLGRYSEALELQQENSRRLRESSDPDGFVEEEVGECLLALGRGEEGRPHFESAYQLLSSDKWIANNEGGRLERLRALARVT